MISLLSRTRISPLIRERRLFRSDEADELLNGRGEVLIVDYPIKADER